MGEGHNRNFILYQKELRLPVDTLAGNFSIPAQDCGKTYELYQFPFITARFTIQSLY